MGSGGREHALAWRLRQSAHPPTLFAAPGNPGIASLAHCLSCAPTDIRALVAVAREYRIDLTVVGPEAPLAAGIVDAFRAEGLRIFGPTAQAAQLETSKVFAKRLMRRYGIPTADFEVFETAAAAMAYVRPLNKPVVVKADGLAGGKGVVVADDAREAEGAIRALMLDRVHGAAGDRVVIEDRLEGFELSMLALVNQGHVAPLSPAQDYKRLLDGDRGPNTGGMGAVAPARVPSAIVDRVVDEILQPVVAAMEKEGTPYTGVLYAGVIVTADGPQVLEFNCRWGDPEAQVILPVLGGDLADILSEALQGPPPRVLVQDVAAVCVVLASAGYPGSYAVGSSIQGLADLPPQTMVFHAGTGSRNGDLVTAGGRVLNVVGVARTLPAAVERAYAAVQRINFAGMHFRTDIGTHTAAFAASGSPDPEGAFAGNTAIADRRML